MPHHQRSLPFPLTPLPTPISKQSASLPLSVPALGCIYSQNTADIQLYICNCKVIVLTDCLTLSVDLEVPEGRICILFVYSNISRANIEPGHTEWYLVNSHGINKIQKGFSYTEVGNLQCLMKLSTLALEHSVPGLPINSFSSAESSLQTCSLLAGELCSPTATRAKTASVAKTPLGRSAQAQPSWKNLIQKETNKEKPEREGCLYYS